MATATSYTQAAIDAMQTVQDDQIAAIDGASIDTANIDPAGNLTLTRKDTSVINAGQVISTPTGSIVMYGGLSAPTGWLVCDGSAVSRTGYSDLFALFGTRFGAGDGSTTFNLPNLVQRFPRMDNSNVGATGGADSHTHTVPAHDHDLNNGSPPGHAQLHAVTGPGPNIQVKRENSVATYTSDWEMSIDQTNMATNNRSATRGIQLAGHTVTSTITPASASSLPSYLNLNFIVKT